MTLEMSDNQVVAFILHCMLMTKMKVCRISELVEAWQREQVAVSDSSMGQHSYDPPTLLVDQVAGAR